MSSLRPRGCTASKSRLWGEYEFIPCQRLRIPLVSDRPSNQPRAAIAPDQGGRLRVWACSIATLLQHCGEPRCRAVIEGFERRAVERLSDLAAEFLTSIRFIRRLRQNLPRSEGT